MRAVNSSDLHLGGVIIPVKVYKTFKPFEFSASRYHADCGTKMVQPYFCPDHPDQEEYVTYSAIDVGGKLVTVPNELRASLLEKGAPLTVHGMIPMKDMAEFLLDNMVVENYHILPDGIDEVRSPNLVGLQALLVALGRRNRALLCSMGAGGLKRNCLLLPNGNMMALAYAEERIEMPTYEAKNYPDVNGHMLRFIDGLPVASGGKPSLRAIKQRVEDWLNSHVTPPRKNAKKTKTTRTTTRKADANA